MDAISAVRKQSRTRVVWGSTQKWLCHFSRKWSSCLTGYSTPCIISRMYVFMYVGFETLFYVARHLDSTASYLPTGLHLGLFRSWPSLYLPSSFSSVFFVLFCFGIHFNAILGNLPSAILWTWPYHVSWLGSIYFIIGSSNPICYL